MARNEELEARIAEQPEERGGYEVYADWLLSEGDPRGELIGLMLGAEGQSGLDAQIAALQEAQAVPGILTWRRGFVDTIALDRIRIDDPVAQVLATVLDHPASALVSAIDIRDFSPSEALAATIDVIAKRAPHTVRSVSFATANELPNLRLDLPKLAKLSVTSLEAGTSYVAIRGMSMALGAQALRDIVDQHWPLTHLTLDFSQGWGTFEDLRPLFERSDATITHLAVTVRIPMRPAIVELPELLVRALVASPIAAQLEQLDLEMPLSRGDYRLLLNNRDRFPRLRVANFPNKGKAQKLIARSAGYNR